MDGLVDTPNRRLLYEKLDINQVVVSSNAILEWLILASVSIKTRDSNI